MLRVAEALGQPEAVALGHPVAEAQAEPVEVELIVPEADAVAEAVELTVCETTICAQRRIMA